MSAYQTLGIPEYSSRDEARKAYRRLAMKHHPDRGGDPAAFKAMKEAFEELERSGFPSAPKAKPQSEWKSWQQAPWPSRRPPEEPARSTGFDFNEFKKANRAAPNGSVFEDLQPNAEPVVRVSLRDAFSGFQMESPRRSMGGGIQLNTDTLRIPPGIPDGYRGRFTSSSGQHEYVTVKIDGGNFRIRGFSNQDNIFSAGLNIGDIEIDVELDAIDLLTGVWIDTQDFLGEKLKVRVPSGFNPLHRLKIAGKGYYGWLQEYNRPSTTRQNMYIRITPVFNKLEDIDPEKIRLLHSMMESHVGNA